jgi:flagellar basal body-associated protein FliL
LLAKMPIQKLEHEPSYVEAKIVVLIVLVVAGLGLAGGYVIFPLLQVQATEPVITGVNSTNNTTTQSHTPTSKHIKTSTNNTTNTVQKAVKNTTSTHTTNTGTKVRNSSSSNT